FKRFTRLLGRLALAESKLREDCRLKQLLALFTLVREEAGELLDFIENRALHAEGLDAKARELLDSTSYAVRMELRKAFEHELAGFCSLRLPTQLFARVENACGLLRDCFRQSVVALAQGLDPSLDGAWLFTQFETKLQQSLALRLELWRLMRFVRGTVSASEPPPAEAVRERLLSFRQGGQRFLMYKDFEPFERFVEEVEDSRSPEQLAAVLHRFDAFLETLFGQVNMRAVLAEHPFEPPAE
ncbi:MAG TPA: hypothetical protein VD968_09225, partial [Pyrinomonadaceae bacterium]|nr:hypothetical protein [Pyrinomonadaceae bacterium]